MTPLFDENSFSLANFLSLLVLGSTSYITLFYYRYYTRPSPLPGPLPLPIIGNVLQYTGDAGKFLKQLRSIYGDIFEIYIGTTRTVCLCQPNLIENLLSPSPTSNFQLRTPPNDGLDDLGVTSKGIFFNRNYDDWVYHRKFLKKSILTTDFAKDAVDSTQLLFQELDDLWIRLGYDHEFDLSEWIPQLTFENIVLLTTKLRIYSITDYYNMINPQNKVVEPEGTLQNSKAYVESIKTFFESLHFFLLTPKLIRNSPGVKGTTNRLLNNVSWLIKNVLGIVKLRRGQIETSEEKINTNDFLTQLLTVNTVKDITKGITDDKHTIKMCDDDVRANLMEILGTGTFTLANTFCYVVYYLFHHPDVKNRMVQELDKILENDRDAYITSDQISKLEYTDAIIKEVLRIFPTVPVNVRANTKPEGVAGYTFPANTQFLIDIEGIHHSSGWTEPEKFNPDRWLDGSPDIKQRKNSYFPFGFGSRICPGKNLALLEIKILTALLYKKYDVELVDKVSPVKYNYRFVKACDELKIKIKPRTS